MGHHQNGNADMKVLQRTPQSSQPVWGGLPEAAGNLVLAGDWAGMLYLQGNGILAIQWCLPDGQGEGGQAARAS